MYIALGKIENKKYYGQIIHGQFHIINDDIYSDFTLSDKKYPLSEIKLLVPVQPTKIILTGLNYIDHAKELDMPLPEVPIIFLKPNTTLIAHKEIIILPHISNRIDYEAELAIIIKKQCKNIDVADVSNYILGYTALNDVTARDLQKKDGQWTRAKSFDTFCPVGPCIKLENNIHNIDVKSYLNDTIKQSSNTNNFIFTIEEIVSFCSKIMTLYPGDIISTGTPPGIGPMKSGDKIEIQIGDISLINYVK